MTQKRKVLLTGACGVISSLLIPELKDRYDLTLTDVKSSDKKNSTFQHVQIANLTDSNRDNYRHLFQNVDTVIHNGFVGRGSRNAGAANFEDELTNVRMAHNIYQTSWEENVGRVVMSSSNHASDYYENLLLDRKLDFIGPETQNRSYGYYGWAKDTYEHLGFLFALARQTGRPLPNIQIRIGGPRETDLERCQPGDLRTMRRALAVYISQRDLVQLYVKSIETESIEDKYGVPFQIFYGISNNTHAYWSIVNARKVLGYEPQDNSELRFAKLIHNHIAAAIR